MRDLRNGGFTLLEIGIVLIVLSIMLSGTLGAMAQKTRLAKQTDLRRKLDAIEDALIGFSKAGTGRLPCPADGTAQIAASDFGVETTPPGACSSGTPTGTFNDANNTVGGVVPVRTLGLPDEYMFDPWGGRLTYIVDKRIAADNAFANFLPSGSPVHGVDDDTTRSGSITVKDHYIVDGADVVSVRTTHAIVAIISHGQNGHGAFQVSGVRKSAGSNNSDEQANCHCDAAGTPLSFDAICVMQASPINSTEPSPNNFDDVLRYYSRANYLSASDRLTEAR